MYRIPFPFIDVALVLTPPLESLPGWAQLLLGLFGLFLTGALLLWLYSYEVRLIRAVPALGLLGLRVVALTLLWFICLQPVFTWPSRQKLTGRVLVALDR